MKLAIGIDLVCILQGPNSELGSIFPHSSLVHMNYDTSCWKWVQILRKEKTKRPNTDRSYERARPLKLAVCISLHLAGAL